jgi:hypothetical protein
LREVADVEAMPGLRGLLATLLLAPGPPAAERATILDAGPSLAIADHAEGR